MPGEIGRARQGDLLEIRHLAADQAGIRQVAGAQDAVDAFRDQIDHPVALAEVQGDVGIPGDEVRQGRKHEETGQGPLEIDAQGTARFGIAENCLRLVQVRAKLDAALLIEGAVERGSDPPGRPLEQTDPEIPLEPLDRRGRGGARETEIDRRRRKTAALYDADEEAHDVDPVHARR